MKDSERQLRLVTDTERFKSMNEFCDKIAARAAFQYKLPEQTIRRLISDIILALIAKGNNFSQPTPLSDERFITFPVEEIQEPIKESNLVDVIVKTFESYTKEKYSYSAADEIQREVSCGKYGRADLVTKNAIIEVKTHLTLMSARQAISQLETYKQKIHGKILVLAGLIVPAELEDVKYMAKEHGVYVLGIIPTDKPIKKNSRAKWKRILFGI
jgi:hypothetical protein